MRRMLLGSALVVALCGQVFGNTGIFFGSGHSLQLVKSADVQMVSEEVTITPICGDSAMTHSVDFRCKFVLKNRSAKPVRIQAGFPLDREPRLIEQDDTDAVLAAHFIARGANNTYHVRHVAGDPQSKYAHVFLWDMEFAAGQTRTLHVGYLLPMSFAAFTTRKMDDPMKALAPPQYEKPWHARIEACMVMHFSYITETGQSWAGSIEHATFRVRNTGFEHSLRKLPEYVGANPADLPAGVELPEEALMDGFVFGLKLGTVWPKILPAGWKASYIPEISPGEPKPSHEPDGIQWHFQDYKPGPRLEFTYYLVGFPATAADCGPWVRCVLGNTRNKADVLELREITAAFFGVPPQTAAVQRLAEQQVWYNPQSTVREAELSESQRAILARLLAIADE